MFLPIVTNNVVVGFVTRVFLLCELRQRNVFLSLEKDYSDSLQYRRTIKGGMRNYLWVT